MSDKELEVAGLQVQINELKQKLTDTDYKVIKCMENSLMSYDLPYDINEVHTERQSIRNKINELEEAQRVIESEV